MGRRLSQHSKIIDRRHNAAACQMMPDPIDHHPGRKRIVRSEQALGQLTTPAAAIQWSLVMAGDGRQESPGYHVRRRAGIAAYQQVFILVITLDRCGSRHGFPANRVKQHLATLVVVFQHLTNGLVPVDYPQLRSLGQPLRPEDVKLTAGQLCCTQTRR